MMSIMQLKTVRNVQAEAQESLLQLILRQLFLICWMALNGHLLIFQGGGNEIHV